jgi:CubicO group peptidase (beta-lactamase class C family)
VEGYESIGQLRTLVSRYRVPGAHLVVHRMGRTAATILGVADSATDRAVTAASVFPFGSVTKAFTATVVAQLAADGDLDLDAPLYDLLPELGGAEWRCATPRQLLSHSGGLVADHEMSGRSVAARRYVLDCLGTGSVAPPGTAFSYSNTGYVVLGRLIESVTGYPWSDAVESFVAAPLGIHLSYVDTNTPWTSVAGHAVTERAVVPVEVTLPSGWAPAGGLAGSASDLVALARLHLGELSTGILPAAAAAEMRRGVPGLEPFGLANGWGLGLALYADGWVGHDGTLGGTSCHLRFHPESGTAVALTTNGSTGPALWEAIWHQWCRPTDSPSGQRPSAPGRRHGRTDADLTDYVGHYRNGTTVFAVRALAGAGELSLRDGAGYTATLVPRGEDVFRLRNQADGLPPQVGRFLRDDGGQVTALQFSGRLAARTARENIGSALSAGAH